MNLRNRSCKALLVAVFALCLQSAAANADTVEIQLVNHAFVPSEVTITVGDTIRWVNTTSTLHTTTSGNPCRSNGLWDVSLPGLNTTFTREFASEGTFPYFCAIHCPAMTGTITVEGAVPAESSTWGKVKALFR